MWRIHPWMRWIWGALFVGTFINLISSGVLELLTAGNLTLNTASRLWLADYGIWLVTALLTCAALAYWSHRSWISREHATQFKVRDHGRNLVPGHFGFSSEPIAAGMTDRPYHQTYLPRNLVPIDSHESTARQSEEDLRKLLLNGKSIVICGSPTEGKTRTLFEITRHLPQHCIVIPLKQTRPDDDAIKSLRGERVVIVLDDLNDYIGSTGDVLSLPSRVAAVAARCAVLASCRDGREMTAVTASIDSGMARFFETFDIVVRLQRLTAEELNSLAAKIGQKGSYEVVTPGSVTMEEPLKAMKARFDALAETHREVLFSAKALVAYGVIPLTALRLRSVAAALFERDVDIRYVVRELATQGFVKDIDERGTIVFEAAYLSHVLQPFAKPAAPRLVTAFAEHGDYDALYYLAASLIDSGQHDDALDALRNATQIRSDFAPLWVLTGVALLGAKRSDEALVACERALKESPNLASAWSCKSEALIALNRENEGLAAAERAIDLRPDLHHAWVAKSWALYELDRLDDALTALDEALRLQPTGLAALSNRITILAERNQLSEALDGCDFLLSHYPQHFQTLLSLASLHLRCLQPHEALEAVNAALDLRPDHAEALTVKVSALALAGEAVDAMRLAEMATTRRPDLPMAWLAKGSALMAAGRVREAIVAYDEATRLFPAFGEAWLAKAQAFQSVGMMEECIAASERAIQLGASNPLVLGIFVGALAAMGQLEQASRVYDERIKNASLDAFDWTQRTALLTAIGRYQEAIEASDVDISSGASSVSWTVRAELLLMLGRIDEGRAAADEAVRLAASAEEYVMAINARALGAHLGGKPNEALIDAETVTGQWSELPQGWINRSGILLSLGRADEALSCAETALRLDSALPEAWCVKALALAEIGDMPEAAAAAEQGLRRNPRSSAGWTARAKILAAAGDTVAAVDAYTQALKFGPRNSLAWLEKGHALFNLGRADEAIQAYDEALTIRPEWFMAQNARDVALASISEGPSA